MRLADGGRKMKTNITKRVSNSLDTNTINELPEEDINWFNWFVPKGGYGTHTIDHIKILTIVNEEELL